MTEKKPCTHIFKQGKNSGKQCGKPVCKKDANMLFCANHYKQPLTGTDLLDKQYQDMLDKDKKEENECLKKGYCEVIEPPQVRDKAPEPEKEEEPEKESNEESEDEYDNDDNVIAEIIDELKILRTIRDIKTIRLRLSSAIDYLTSIVE